MHVQEKVYFCLFVLKKYAARQDARHIPFLRLSTERTRLQAYNSCNAAVIICDECAI